MVRRPCYVVDAFSDRPFAGNSAGVVLDAEDLSTTALQGIAEELKHAETAFPLPPRDAQAAFHLRWFTTFCEVGFCGHATLAALHVLAGEAGRIRVDAEEDPVTGSASAQLALLVHGFQPAPAPRRFVFSQGDELGRPGRIDIELRAGPGSESPRAWLSGSALTTLRGELIL